MYLAITILIVLAPLSLSSSFPWISPEELNRNLPSSVRIFTLNTTSSIFSSKLTGGYARFNLNDTRLEFIVKDSNMDALGYNPKTPMQYAEEQQNVVYAVLNGGYFDMVKNVSSSFLAEQGKIKSKNSINQATNKYPTVGVFGNNSNVFSAEYAYSFGEDLKTYTYQLPNQVPGPAPTPSNGTLYTPRQSIGAGPILVKNGRIINGNPQNFNQANMINFRHPRSAICIDYSNQLYLVAIDGRYEGSDGLTMPELAILMDDLKCKSAMNLDGGGSTLLFANGKIINKPSDATGPRPVVSAVLIRDRFQKKQAHLLAE